MGEGLVLASALERAKERGHRPVGIYATAAGEAAALSAWGPCATEAEMTPGRFVAAHPADVLISAANRHVLDAAALAAPRLGCVNYHNGPLPDYAGLRATAWAVLNGERTHGVTWHRMDGGIDTGGILAQRMFGLGAEETTASLNARCTAAAIGCLDALFGCIEAGDLAGRSQGDGARRYFGRGDVAPDAGVIDWTWPAARVVRLVRACTWGPAANDFGLAAVVLDGAAAFVLAAREAHGAAAAGVVVAADGCAMTVGCGEGCVALELDRPLAVQPGRRMDVLDAGRRAALAAWHRAALRAELRALPALRRLAGQGAGHGAGQGPALRVDAGAAEVAAGLAAVAGRQAVLAVRTPELLAGLCEGWAPLHFGAGGPTPGVGLPGGLHLRRPEFAGLHGWPARAAASWWEDEAGGRWLACRDEAVAAGVAAALAGPGACGAEAAPRPTVVELLDQLADAAPAAAAMQEGGRIVSRGELRARSLAMAAALAAAGVRAEDGVGLLLPAGIDFVVGALAAMRAGAAYVPLDLGAPPARTAHAVADAGIVAVVAGPGRVVPGVAMVAPAVDGMAACVSPAADPARCAYRVFTSGSTGRPKAVEVEHAALSNLIAHYHGALGLGPATRWPMLASVVFDASAADVWPALAAGGAVLVPPAGLLVDVDGLIAWLDAVGATAAFVPTAIAERALPRAWPAGMTLRTLLTGGDTLHRRPPPGLPFRVLNTYGPTENTVDSLWHEVGPGEGRPPIGRPILGVTALVLDDAGRPVADGEVGELVLGGAQVARGYRGQAGLTARAFERDPAAPAARRYRTGDRVSRDGAGVFSFHGRRDDQVQLRGIRVELGEIEAIAKADARFAEVVCVAERTGPEVSGLAVFAVAAPGVQVGTGELAALFAAHLPPAIRPGTIRMMDRLPRGATGKLDRAALATSRATPSRASRAADRRLEAGSDPVLAAWTRQVGSAAGDFWSAGGDSLAALTVLLEVEETAGVRVPLGSFIVEPTLAGLRRAVAAKATPGLVELVAAPAPAPVIVVWYAVNGDLGAYRHLIRGLGGFRVVGLVSPGLGDAGRWPASIEAAAADGLRVLRAAGLACPAAMIGYSWAGLLAFEAVRQMRAGGALGGPYLAMIGTVPPAGRLSAAFRRASKATLLAGWYARDAVRALPKGRLPSVRRDDWAGLERHHYHLARLYRPARRAPVEAELFRERIVHGVESWLKRRLTLADAGWRWWVTTPIRLTWLECDHRNVIKEQGAAVLAGLIRARLAARDAGALAGQAFPEEFGAEDEKAGEEAQAEGGRADAGAQPAPGRHAGQRRGDGGRGGAHGR